MKQIIYAAILTVALLSFGRQQSAAQGADAAAQQEVRQAIKKYRTALLQRDAATLEQIWADDYTFTNGAGETHSKAQRLANLKSGATLARLNQPRRRYEGAGSRRCGGGDRPRNHQRSVQRQTSKWPIQQHKCLGKRCGRLAVGSQPANSCGGEVNIRQSFTGRREWVA
jgi:Domain of unknown function (DUF4440)